MQPYFIIMDGPPPSEDASATAAHTYHIFDDPGSQPELVFYTMVRGVGASNQSSRRLPSPGGYYKLDLQVAPFKSRKIGGVARHLQVERFFYRPSVQEAARLVRKHGNPRAVILMGGSHDLIKYSAQLLRAVPEVPASILIWDEILDYIKRYRNPLSRQAITTAYEYLFQRCDRRFVGSEPHAEHYRELFGRPFGALLPAVRDDQYHEALSRKATSHGELDAKPTVFLSGTQSTLLFPSVRCLAQAFQYVSTQTGHKPMLIVCGSWKTETLVKLGFAEDQIRNLGWLGTRQDVLSVASAATCTYLPYFADEKTYAPLRWEFPGRTADYLLAGPPMLVTSYTTSAVAQYFKNNNLDFLCERLDCMLVGQTLIKIAGLDQNQREAIRQRYLDMVQRYHLASKIREALAGENNPKGSLAA